jgi:hypothetical protein
MLNLSPNDEAEKIVDLLFEEFGNPSLRSDPEDFTREVVYVDGMTALEWMKEEKLPGWRDVEWAGYYVRHKLRYLCEENYPMHFKSHIQGRQIRIMGKYLWDIRFRNSDTKPNVVLNDLNIFNDLVRENDGIGLIVLNAHVSYEDDRQLFKKYQDELKETPSEYDLESETIGRPPKLRKTGFYVRRVFAYYFPEDNIFTGLHQWWMDNTYQKGWKNADGSLRNPKYTIDLKKDL